MQTKLIDIDVETASSSNSNSSNSTTKSLHMKIDTSMLKIPTFKIVNNSHNSDHLTHKISFKRVNSSPVKKAADSADQIGDTEIRPLNNDIKTSYNTLINELDKSAKFDVTEKNKSNRQSNQKDTKIQTEKSNFKSILRQNPPKVIKQSEITKTEIKQAKTKDEPNEPAENQQQNIPIKQSLPRKSKNKEPQQKQEQQVPADVINKPKKQSKLTQSTLPFNAAKKIEPKIAQPAAGNLNTFASLRNLGSTCYINCIIQVMRYTPGFVASIHRLNKQLDNLEALNNEIESEISTNNNAKFVKNLHQLLVEMADKEKQDRRPIYSPAKFVKTVWTLLSFWSNGSQQDAHEFLQYTIHFINECDIFIRKLQQQHQIKQCPLNDENQENLEKNLINTDILPPPAPITPPSKQRRTKNSLKSAENTTLPIKNSPIPMQVNEESTEKPEALRLVINQKKISERFIKTNLSNPLKPTNSTMSIHKTTCIENFLRTPTKGGASTSNNNSTPSKPPLPISKPSNTKSPVKKCSPISKEAEDLYSFENENTKGFNIFKGPFEEKMDISFQEPKIADKDLVSKRLKETILKNDNKPIKLSPKPYSRRSAPSTDFEYTQNNFKKMKHDITTGFHLQNLNESNSFIIIDSDNEEETEIFRAAPPKKKYKAAPKIDDKKQSILKTNNLLIKKFNVLIEDLDVKDIVSKNKDLKISNSALDYLNIEKSSITYQNPELKPNNIKRLKTRSKTMPSTTISQINNSYMMNGSLVDLDAITVINPVSKPVNVMNNNGILSTNPITNFRSKLRSTATPQKVEQAPSLSLCSVLPPSPAELLRKYSATNGYTCEMDKLFKGQSVTVTQCLECENLRKCPEAFYDRSIPIDTNDDAADEDQNGHDWISKCLSNESYLNENSKYMCDKCQSKQEAKIHTQYTQMPSILILHLLSYGITSSIDGNLNAQKLSNRSRLVNYFNYTSTREAIHSKTRMTNAHHDWMKSPLSSKLKINQNLSSKHHFKLFGVVMHSGTTLNSGHYTAFVNYKIISEATTPFINDLSLSLFSKSPSTQRNENTTCSCFVNTKKTLNSSQTTEALPIKGSQTKSSDPDSEAQWLHFDDTKVKSLTNLEFHRKIIDSSYDSPYILFYVKE